MSKKITLIPSWYKAACDTCTTFTSIKVKGGTVSSCNLIEAGESCKVKTNV